MPQPPERRASKITAIAGMVSLPASGRSHLHQPQKPAVSNLHWQEQPRPPSKTIKAAPRQLRIDNEDSSSQVRSGS